MFPLSGALISEHVFLSRIYYDLLTKKVKLVDLFWGKMSFLIFYSEKFTKFGRFLGWDAPSNEIHTNVLLTFLFPVVKTRMFYSF